MGVGLEIQCGDCKGAGEVKGTKARVHAQTMTMRLQETSEDTKSAYFDAQCINSVETNDTRHERYDKL